MICIMIFTLLVIQIAFQLLLLCVLFIVAVLDSDLKIMSKSQ
jgi:hypothetical protein